eukprot:15579497-Heterocapsa_arctica.AAC.1
MTNRNVESRQPWQIPARCGWKQDLLPASCKRNVLSAYMLSTMLMKGAGSPKRRSAVRSVDGVTESNSLAQSNA